MQAAPLKLTVKAVFVRRGVGSRDESELEDLAGRLALRSITLGALRVAPNVGAEALLVAPNEPELAPREPEAREPEVGMDFLFLFFVAKTSSLPDSPLQAGGAAIGSLGALSESDAVGRSIKQPSN